MDLTLAQRCALIELFVLDVDGCLTDGAIIYAGTDVELKAFHVRDGSGLKLWRDAGKRAAIISGRNSPAVARRASELGIDLVIQGTADKQAALMTVLKATRLEPHQAAGMGDDLPDLPLLRTVGLAVTVPDAAPEVRRAAHYITQALAGRGAASEAIELILRCQGTWQNVLDQ